jgi:O-antigen/teichoic acid export membrane protein
LSGIKQLANQTLWYGLSNIAGRFINYLLNPILTYIYAPEQFGEISLLYAYAAFLNIIFTYGMETSYFRFNQQLDEKKVFNTAFTSLLISTSIFSLILLIPAGKVASLLELGNHPEYVAYVVAIVGLDTLAVLPFSKIRFEGKPRKFALIKVINILVNFSLIIFFLMICKPAHESNSTGFLSSLYNPSIGIGYVFIAGVAASLVTILLLTGEFKTYKPSFDKKLLTDLLLYSTPLIVVGFGGVINETIDRFMILFRFNGTVEAAKAANGIYSANNKLAILIVLFTQTFRMGAEPFFFKNSTKENAKETYARIMNFFVIASCLCFLGVVLFLDIWKYFMGINKHPEYLEGLYIIPILMLSKLFLGIYYNLSIWYKLTNKNNFGAVITILGAVITIFINYLLIPRLGFYACALANFLCYGTMMLISYFQGQKYYAIPYEWKKCLGYISIACILYLMHHLIRNTTINIMALHLTGVLFTIAFLVIVLQIEKEEFRKIPFLQKIFKLH